MSHTKRSLTRKFVGIGLVLGGLLSHALSQRPELPLVIAAKMPLYPMMARAARIQGVVKIRVTTDGEKVTSLEAESGPPMLVKFAKESIATWEFLKHKPTTFVTTFRYVIEGPEECTYSNGVSALSLPLEVRISVRGVETCDPAAEIKPHN